MVRITEIQVKLAKLKDLSGAVVRGKEALNGRALGTALRRLADKSRSGAAMKALRNIKIGAKLAIGFGVALSAVCLIGGLAIYQVSRVYQGTAELANNWMPSVVALGDLRAATNAVRRGSMGTLLAMNAQERAAQVQKRQDGLAAFDRALSVYQPLISSEHEKQLFAQFNSAWAAYRGGRANSDSRLRGTTGA